MPLSTNGRETCAATDQIRRKICTATDQSEGDLYSYRRIEGRPVQLPTSRKETCTADNRMQTRTVTDQSEGRLYGYRPAG